MGIFIWKETKTEEGRVKWERKQQDMKAKDESEKGWCQQVVRMSFRGSDGAWTGVMEQPDISMMVVLPLGLMTSTPHCAAWSQHPAHSGFDGPEESDGAGHAQKGKKSFSGALALSSNLPQTLISLTIKCGPQVLLQITVP